MVLATLCGGKLADKLRCKFNCIVQQMLMLTLFSNTDIFSQISDSNGQLIAQKLEEYLQQCFLLTAAVGEEPNFYYRPGMAQEIFPNVRVKIVT